MADSVPPHLPVYVVQCVENWWVRGDTLLAMPTQRLKSMERSVNIRKGCNPVSSGM